MKGRKNVDCDIDLGLAILARRDRLELVPDIAQVFRRLLNEHRGIAVAQVTTAVPIDERQKATIASRGNLWQRILAMLNSQYTTKIQIL